MIGLSITLLISLICALIAYSFSSFQIAICVFVASILLQFLVWYIFINFKKNNLLFLQQKLKIAELDVLNRYTYKVKCANCDFEYDTLAFINDENISICPNCKQKNKLIIDIKPVIVLENIQDINLAQNEIYNKLINLQK